MKRTIYTLFLVFVASIAVAQDINKIITREYVDHLIKSLSSDDMQGRGTFTPGIDKAASFIENEFKQIGLKPLEGASGYRQTFYKYQLKPSSAQVTIDGKSIDKNQILVIGNASQQLSFDNTNSDGWVKLNTEKDFSSQYRTLVRSGKKQLVLVDVKFIDAFTRLKGMMGRPIDEKDLNPSKAAALVFVLDQDTVAKDFKVELKSDVVFVAFTAEEIGGYGARYFSQQLNPDDVIAMFNIEMIGKDSKFGKNTAFITGYERSDFGKILQKNLAGTEFTFHPDPYPEQNLFYRSDNATLAALGVPAHTISTDQIDTDKLYHSVKDEYASLDVENILSTIKAIAKSAVSIVKGEDTPTRIPKLETNK
jgi:hypothetical protein